MARKSTRSGKSRDSISKAQAVASETELGDSWVVNENHSDQDGDSDFRITDNEREEQAAPPPRRGSRNPSKVHTGTAESIITQNRISQPEPEFTMPRLEHSSEIRQRKPSIRKLGRPRKEVKQESDTQDAVLNYAQQMLEYAGNVLFHLLDVVGIAFKAMKKPLGYIIAGYILIGIMMMTKNLATQSLYAALSPLCRVPGSSLLDLPFCVAKSGVANHGTEPPPPEFEKLMESQSKFEDILASSSVGLSLPADMKRSEAAVRDLRTLVRYSSLRSRNELALEFDGFIETARMASADLQRFNSHTGGAADIIISTARWTMRTLDEVNQQQASRSGLAAFVSDTVLAPFQPARLTPSLVLDQYIAHTRAVEGQIHRLLEEAQALVIILHNLEERLDIIYDISVRDGQTASVKREELLGQLWTILGGNKSELRKYSSQLSLLQAVSRYRETAWAHVSTTVLKLQAMSAELEELRERVGTVGLLEGRKDVPLRIHLEAIQLGVERLEGGRTAMRTAEKEYLDRALHKVPAEDESKAARGTLIDA